MYIYTHVYTDRKTNRHKHTEIYNAFESAMVCVSVFAGQMTKNMHISFIYTVYTVENIYIHICT